MTADRVGLGWRPQLAAGILSSLNKIDIVEVIADDYFDAPAARVRSLRTLMSQVPLTLHGIGLGPASTAGIDSKRMAKFARLIEQVKPESWSEHLAWVRGGGRELGHLAAPCRNQSTIDATLSNLDRATRMVGRGPMVENIASLINPPASPLSEAQWLSAVMRGGGESRLLLDLHNVHTNAFNFGFDPREFLDGLPLDKAGAIHIAGGRPEGGRILDDHLHDVPDPVFGLLEYVAARAPQALTVILERDGSYPAMGDLLAQLDQARAALARGRAQRVDAVPLRELAGAALKLTDPALEAYLAKVLVEPAERERFMSDPRGEALRAGLRAEQADALEQIDREGLAMAARSFANKRGKRIGGH